jgi:hypothetical protein
VILQARGVAPHSRQLPITENSMAACGGASSDPINVQPSIPTTIKRKSCCRVGLPVSRMAHIPWKFDSFHAFAHFARYRGIPEED